MQTLTRLIPRVLAALAVGLAVFAIACVPAWHSYSGADIIRVRQEKTVRCIVGLDEVIDAHRRETGALPKTLAELDRKAVREHVYTDESGAPCDWWGHPLRYATNGRRYRVTSYGRDGKRGGVGLDCDLSSDDLYPRQAAPTFGQLFSDDEARGFLSGCAAAGLVAFALGLVVVRRPIPTRRDLAKVAVALLGTMAATILVTALLAALEAKAAGRH